MDLSFHCNHLLDYELDYELAIRAVNSNRNVGEKRKMLGKLLRKEISSGIPDSQVILEAYDYDFHKEETDINRSILSISDVITDFEGTDTDSTFLRVRSRINHLIGRVKRIRIPDEEPGDFVNFKNESYATCIKLEADLDDKVISEPSAQASTSFFPQPTSPIVNLNPVITCGSNKQPISSWGVKFNGNPKSVFYFIERVTDLAQAREVTSNQLFNSAVEFFVGDAFIWYRNIKSSVSDWDSLIQQLKKDFLPPFADDEIWESIRQRRQRRNESVTIYIAQLENLFNRLSTCPAEVTKLKYIRKNLLPDYVTQLALQNIDSVANLVALCKKLEEANYITSRKSTTQVSYLGSSSFSGSNQRTERYSRFNKSFSRSPQAQVVDKDNKNTVVDETKKNLPDSNKRKVVCFNCQLPNHTYNVCTEKRKIFCFKCGEPNVKVSSCPKCTKN